MINVVWIKKISIYSDDIVSTCNLRSVVSDDIIIITTITCTTRIQNRNIATVLAVVVVVVPVVAVMEIGKKVNK